MTNNLNKMTQDLIEAARKATHGEWKYQEVADKYTHIVRTGKNRFLCQLNQDTSGESEANARLIALANPQTILSLCEKFKEALDVIKYYGDEMSYTVDSYEGISGEMRARVVLYGDSSERNDVYSYAGKRAREFLSKMDNNKKGDSNE